MTDAGATRPEGLVRSMLRAIADEVAATRDAALRGEDDGVHAHRTAVRRARGVLAALRRELDPGGIGSARVALAAWGRDLGVVRDAEVRADSAQAVLDALGIQDGRVRARLVEAPRAEMPGLVARLAEIADEPRIRAGSAALDDLARTTPPGDPDDDRRIARRLLRREVRRTRRAAVDADAPLDELHEFRKAARRLRHVAEAVHRAAPDIRPTRTVHLAKAAKRVHRVLGDHRDAVLLHAVVTRARARAAHAGDPVEPYDRMLRTVDQQTVNRLAELPEAAAALR